MVPTLAQVYIILINSTHDFFPGIAFDMKMSVSGTSGLRRQVRTLGGSYNGCLINK